jgi:hypothetical protein
MSVLRTYPSPLVGEGGAAKPRRVRGAKRSFARGEASLTLTQLRLSSFVAKAPYPSPIKGEGGAGL